MRNAAKTCSACPNLRERWQTVCRSCWRRLPVDLRNALTEAKAAQAFVRVEAARVAAVAWLRANPTAQAIARVTGDAGHGWAADAEALPP